MKQGRKAIICISKKADMLYLFEAGNADNFLFGCYLKQSRSNIAYQWLLGKSSEEWGASAISLTGGTALYKDPDILYLMPNVNGYIANNYEIDGAKVHTVGLTRKFMLCVEAYRTKTDATPVIRYTTDEEEGTSDYQIISSIDITATTPTIYRKEITFKQYHRLEFRAAYGCGDLVVNKIWIEEVG